MGVAESTGADIATAATRTLATMNTETVVLLATKFCELNCIKNILIAV